MRAPVVSIIGGTLWGNRGAEAMVATCVGRLRGRQPLTRFGIYSYYPKQDESLLEDTSVSVFDARPHTLLFSHLPQALVVGAARTLGFQWPDKWTTEDVRSLRHSRVLLDVSGISFDDGRLVFLPYKILSIWPAMLLGVPVVKLSQAMGPFDRFLNRLSARFFLSRCRRVYARGHLTASYLEHLGLPEDCRRTAADLAFCFEQGDSLTQEVCERTTSLASELSVLKTRGELVVAVTPSALVFQRSRKQKVDYIELLLALIRSLAGLNATIVIVPNATRAGSQVARNNDLFVIDILRRQAEQDLSPETRSHLRWVEWDLNTDGIRSLIGQCEVLVTSRFHAMVAGLSLAVPTLVIGWSHKYREVLADFGCEELALDYARLESDPVSVLAEIVQRREEFRERISRALPSVRQSSARQLSELDSLLGPPIIEMPSNEGSIAGHGQTDRRR